MRAQGRLEAAFGCPSPVTVRQVFKTLGEDLAQTVGLVCSRRKARDIMPLDPEACRLLDAKRSEGRGVIFVTAHLGPIDVMAASVAEHGYPAATLARESYDPRFTALYESLRAPRGVQTIYRGRPGMETAVIRALRRGLLVGFPMDLAGRGMETRKVPFLGESTPMPVGPARLARRLRVPVVVGSPAPAPGGMIVTVEPLDADANESEESVIRAMASALERRIRALPAHWVWMHGA